MKKPLIIAFLTFLMIFTGLDRASSVDDCEHYFSQLEDNIAKTWRSESLVKYGIPKDFRLQAKAVVSFRLTKEGKIKHVHLKHSSTERLLIFTYRYFGNNTQIYAQRLDFSLIEAVKNISLQAIPPKLVGCPKDCVAIFDLDRFSCVKVMVDDHIPIREDLIDQY